MDWETTGDRKVLDSVATQRRYKRVNMAICKSIKTNDYDSSPMVAGTEPDYRLQTSRVH